MSGCTHEIITNREEFEDEWKARKLPQFLAFALHAVFIIEEVRLRPCSGICELCELHFELLQFIGTVSARLIALRILRIIIDHGTGIIKVLRLIVTERGEDYPLLSL